MHVTILQVIIVDAFLYAREERITYGVQINSLSDCH